MKRGYTWVMRQGVAAAAVSLVVLVAAPLAGARFSFVTGSMTVSASPHAAGAHGVRLKVTLHYEMQCGYPGKGPLVVTFPSAMKLPTQFAAGSILLAGSPVSATVDGRQVTVIVPPHKGVLCNAVGPGSLTLAFTHAAKLENPKQAGAYSLRATHSRRTFTAKLRVKSP